MSKSLLLELLEAGDGLAAVAALSMGVRFEESIGFEGSPWDKTEEAGQNWRESEKEAEMISFWRTRGSKFPKWECPRRRSFSGRGGIWLTGQAEVSFRLV
jgi:hypothetical protein